MKGKLPWHYPLGFRGNRPISAQIIPGSGKIAKIHARGAIDPKDEALVLAAGEIHGAQAPKQPAIAERLGKSTSTGTASGILGSFPGRWAARFGNRNSWGIQHTFFQAIW